MKKLAFLLLMLPLTACGQVTPTEQQVSLTWTIPTKAALQAAGIIVTPSMMTCDIGQPTCTFIISRAILDAGTDTCPITTGTAYSPLNQGSPATGAVFNDTTAAGMTVCYIAQTFQGGLVSPASNSVGPFVLPGNPQRPLTVKGNASAGLTEPQIAPDGKAQVAKLMLQGRVTEVR